MSGWSKGDIAAAKELLESHKSQARQERRRKSFDLLWQALEEMRKAGAAEFKLADVGRKSESLGGPKPQSLRNPAGAAFREVIGLYSAAFTKPALHAGGDPIGRALATVANASARKILADRLQELKALETERDRLRMAIAAASPSPLSVPFEAIPSAAPTGKASEWGVEAFQSNFNPARLAERGLAIAADGSIRNEQGATIFSSDLIDAMDELLRANGRPALREKR
ncbi:gamma-mobile-trio protein GmtX [Pseudoduganella aquatica]|uniref:Uncharacterized protein n=1 Tax=Pseudoduganella aquatica TaxID=2660641 RepID=A0A7X4HH96_9BURK|nr:gamma-mobile-trio protein GmtX [Pseudoduganella aquatica]MYN11238.1 hypothetical protein [Pseudoduganella aquatica]